jgi:hypothetical protein
VGVGDHAAADAGGTRHRLLQRVSAAHAVGCDACGGGPPAPCDMPTLARCAARPAHPTQRCGPITFAPHPCAHPAAGSWVAKWPTVQDLAAATQDEVGRRWARRVWCGVCVCVCVWFWAMQPAACLHLRVCVCVCRAALFAAPQRHVTPCDTPHQRHGTQT